MSKMDRLIVAPVIPPAQLGLYERLVVYMSEPVAGVNWYAPEHNAPWGSYRWSGPGTRATLSIPIRRNCEALAVVVCRRPQLMPQLWGLRVEVDGVGIPHTVHRDARCRCIVVRLPARDALPGAATELALVLPRTVSPVTLGRGNTDSRMLGLAVSSVWVVPATPALPVMRTGWLSLEPLKDDLPLSYFDGITYLEANQDVAEAVIAGRMPSGLAHYRRYGRKEGRQLVLAATRTPNEGRIAEVFDGSAYLDACPDVAADVRSGVLASALEHYLKHGRKEGRRFFTRFDGQGSVGTAIELVRRDTIREARAGIDALKAQLADESAALAGQLGARLAKIESTVPALATASDVTAARSEFQKIVGRLDTLQGELGHINSQLTTASAREARERALLAQVNALKHGLMEVQQRLTAAARVDDLARLRHDALQSALHNEIAALEQLRREIIEYNRLRDSKETVIRSEVELIKQELSIAQTSGVMSPGASGGNGSAPGKSWSQLGQDLWVIQQCRFKKRGYFVDIGATDGVLLNNTYLLESHYHWQGICIEPDPEAFERLSQNRKSHCSDACLWSSTGKELDFILAKEFGAIVDVADTDMHAERRNAYKKTGEMIKVRTTSLNDLLTENKAPRSIDYISLDTEGSEYEILSTFDFKRWKVRMWTIEHNFTEQRQRIYELMSANGYKRREVEWDDWYYL